MAHEVPSFTSFESTDSNMAQEAMYINGMEQRDELLNSELPSPDQEEDDWEELTIPGVRDTDLDLSDFGLDFPELGLFNGDLVRLGVSDGRNDSPLDGEPLPQLNAERANEPGPGPAQPMAQGSSSATSPSSSEQNFLVAFGLPTPRTPVVGSPVRSVPLLPSPPAPLRRSNPTPPNSSPSAPSTSQAPTQSQAKKRRRAGVTPPRNPPIFRPVQPVAWPVQMMHVPPHAPTLMMPVQAATSSLPPQYQAGSPMQLGQGGYAAIGPYGSAAHYQMQSSGSHRHLGLGSLDQMYWDPNLMADVSQPQTHTNPPPGRQDPSWGNGTRRSRQRVHSEALPEPTAGSPAALTVQVTTVEQGPGKPLAPKPLLGCTATSRDRGCVVSCLVNVNPEGWCRRGRPRKAVSEEEQRRKNQMPKRGRGRPRGSKNRLKVKKSMEKGKEEERVKDAEEARGPLWKWMEDEQD
ncbi:hypothetical protein P152DRAFT_502356 [Eremomyces bilateralis CBS 781.70]|uniref:Uncharacterized protein n=1 Tax=Eremomyces bilateralis CBS 781.70 TaxID=1392243 RepID=A0A6G1G5F7_9PEZI|nr:uncharacterized protein P152DRAFT_502356 [Eremomyces bilateralis CBS 781.70]KAF1813232.1 hypothetical protein P152DRAFT_502356 [Eremomyces bilateralis CBS 781.70]